MTAHRKAEPASREALEREIEALRADLSEEKRRSQHAESVRLMASEALNRTIMDVMPGGLVHVAADGAILAANAEALRILGITYDALTKRFTNDFAHETILEDGSPCAVADYPVSKALMTGERQGPLTIGLKHPDGKLFWAVFTAVPVRGPCEEITGAVVTFFDVTAQREADAALRRSEGMLRSILDSAPNLIATSDCNGKLLFVNNAPSDVVVGAQAWDGAAPSSRAKAEEAFRTVLARGEKQSFECESTLGAHWRVHAGPRYEGDKIVGVTYIAWDATEQKQLETRLAIADRMASIGTLSAAVAHEVNNPLTYVLANVEWAARKAQERGDAASQERLAGALEGITRIRSVVSDLNTFSRVDDEHPVSLDVHSLLESAVRMALAEVRHRAVLVKRYDDVPRVVGVEGRLGQVFLNLLVNAAQAIPEGDVQSNEIVVTTFTDGAGRAVIEVSDTGGGVPDELRARIFDPFVTTKPRGVGTGLGLYICRNIISSMGGELTMRSGEGRGTTFRVELPPASVDAPARRGHGSEPPRSTRSLNILIADDEVAIGNALRNFLEGHHVDVVQSGRDAIEKLGARDYDVLFCDLLMPDLTGMDVYEWAQAHRPHMVPRMIFISGGAFTARARQFLDTISNELIEKPFSIRDIMTALARRRD